MKNLILIVAAALALAIGGYWLFTKSAEAPAAVSDPDNNENAPRDESVAVMETGRYSADVSKSIITWQAGKPAIAGYVHTGQFNLQSGSVDLTDRELSGEFVVDINSLRLTSLGGGKAGQESALEGHLKSQGFFDAANHPTATFRITDVSPKVLPGPGQTDYTASGELTMKGETRPVTFPAKVAVAGEGEVWLTAALEIDRTEWGINFGSAKFTDRITDQIIGDTVTLGLSIKLNKQ